MQLPINVMSVTIENNSNLLMYMNFYFDIKYEFDERAFTFCAFTLSEIYCVHASKNNFFFLVTLHFVNA